jgi:hypothetical protein
VRYTDHLPHTFGLRLENRMSQETPDKTGSLVLPYGKACNAIARMAKLTPVEPQIPGKECHRAKPMQEWDDGFIRHPLLTDLNPDLPDSNAPTSEQLTLAVRNVFIEDVHEPVVSDTNSDAWVTNASRAKRTASAIPSLEIAPRHSSMIASQAIPLATCSKTSATRMRVPRNVGCP